MIDRFSQACAELTDRNPYICDSCTTTFGHPTVETLDDRHLRGGDHWPPTSGPECLLNCDPMPFGD